MPYFRAILTFLAVLVLVGCNSMSPPKKAELVFLDRVKIKQVKELSESEYDAYMSEAVDELKELISKGRGSPYLALKSMNYDAEYDTIEEVSYIDLARMSKDNDRDFSRNGPKINAWGNARSLYQLQFMYTSAQAFCSTPYTRVLVDSGVYFDTILLDLDESKVVEVSVGASDCRKLEAGKLEYVKKYVNI